MTEPTLEFLFSDGERPYRPTEAWVVATNVETSEDPMDWEVLLDDPGEAEHVRHIIDVKRRMIFQAEKASMLTLPRISKSSNFRRYTPQQVFERYLEAVVATCDEEDVPNRVSVLMPALDDDQARGRYLKAIDAAVSQPRILSEPEMVLEYFRLVRGELELDRTRNNVILVVDIGASTANLTIVLTNKGGAVVGGEAGHRRQRRLQAIQGVAGDVAGRWVDERILELWNVKAENSTDAEEYERELVAAEQLKIAVSRTGNDEKLGERELESEYLQIICEDMATALRPHLTRLGDRLWDQLTATDFATQQSESARQDRKASKTAPLRMVDTVILAGGSSQLLGLKLQLAESLDHDPRWLEVGADFGVAAAVGALAHVLESQEDTAFLPPSDAEATDWHFRGGLETDVLFGWRASKNAREDRPIVLRAGDPIVYSGGRRDRVHVFPFKRGDKFDARLLPDVAQKRMRTGLRPITLRVKAKEPAIDIVVDGDRRAHIESDRLLNPSEVWLDLDRNWSASRVQGGGTQDASHPKPPPPGPPDQAYFPASAEIVIDLGMSKTVVVRSAGGRLDVNELKGESPQKQAKPEESVSPIALEQPPAAPGIAAHRETHVEVGPATVVIEHVGVAESAHPYSTEPSPATAVHTDTRKSSVFADEWSLDAELRGMATEHLTHVSNHPVPEHSGVSWRPANRRPANEVGEGLKNLMEGWQARIPSIPAADIVMTVLTLSVRPFVLLAGPPGCGKSTIARQVAALLGKRSPNSFLEVPVHAHWRTDAHLMGGTDQHRNTVAASDALLSQARLAADSVVLFDEVNLARPEHYLRSVFHHHDSVWQTDNDLRWVALGTLNIDDASPPPSAKVLDRCGLIEMDQVGFDQPSDDGVVDLDGLPSLDGLPALPADWKSVDLGWLAPCLTALQEAVRTDHLRQDLLPSHRVRSDIFGILALYDAMELSGHHLLTRDDVLDRLLASRVLVKIAGAIEQVESALAAITVALGESPAPRSKRRLAIAQTQAQLGYVSPWQ